jgi:hypothetical protein
MAAFKVAGSIFTTPRISSWGAWTKPIIAAPDQAARVAGQSAHAVMVLAGVLEGRRGGMRVSESGSDGMRQHWTQS